MQFLGDELAVGGNWIQPAAGEVQRSSSLVLVLAAKDVLTCLAEIAKGEPAVVW